MYVLGIGTAIIITIIIGFAVTILLKTTINLARLKINSLFLFFQIFYTILSKNTKNSLLHLNKQSPDNIRKRALFCIFY